MQTKGSQPPSTIDACSYITRLYFWSCAIQGIRKQHDNKFTASHNLEQARDTAEKESEPLVTTWRRHLAGVPPVMWPK